jgi:hypothetical protein
VLVIDRGQAPSEMNVLMLTMTTLIFGVATMSKTDICDLYDLRA